MRQISNAGILFIKEVEGVKRTAYKDGGGVWTIGVGHTGPDVKIGLVISDSEVDRLLRMDLRTAENAVNSMVKVELTQNQFDALVSFTFNVGTGALQKSTLLKRLNAGSYNSIPAELMKYRYDNGKSVTGLVTRRTKEAALWSKGNASSPSPRSQNAETKKMSLLSPETGIAALGAAGSIGGAAAGPGPLQWAIAFAVVALVVAGAVFAYKRFVQV